MQGNTWLFRCDASEQLGMGHLMRCAALAQALRELGQSTVLVGPASRFALLVPSDAFDEHVELGFAPSSREDALQLGAIAGRYNTRGLVLDDYRVDEPYQGAMARSGLPWLQFDGAAQQNFQARWLINSSPAASEMTYAPRMQREDAQLLLGPRYALLRPEFRRAAEGVARAKETRIFVSLGGGDDRGALRFLIEGLLEALPAPFHIHAVSGRQNPRNQANQAWLASFDSRDVTLSIDPPSVAQIMAPCHLAVMAAGSTCYEANCLGLPMLLLTIAPNQSAHAKAWADTGGARFVGEWGHINKADFKAAARQFLMASLAGEPVRRHVDGQGAQRVAGRLCETST